MSNISMPNGITKGRAMSCCSLGVQTPAATGMFNAASDWVACCAVAFSFEKFDPAAKAVQLMCDNNKNVEARVRALQTAYASRGGRLAAAEPS